ncbi:hypothetical protein [Nostoc sp. UHCC 0870]|uniref:hypothetical protein n=1 Tax=Nostoc sp. UHCC 0870 TaxID=2914041 RepID=UPI001EDE82E8|nr:hypothetical protein [Nostoc sp. UHCC 0870]UKO98545.1 hypothetical protein L6494_02065 [Nostoc sp. UHCC 0870]
MREVLLSDYCDRFLFLKGSGTGDWGLGTGDWGLGTGDWGLGTGQDKEEFTSSAPYTPTPLHPYTPTPLHPYTPTPLRIPASPSKNSGSL